MLKTKRGTTFERFKVRFADEKSPGQGQLIICYLSDFQKKVINECRYIFIDGTFKTAPPGFGQICVIWGQTVNFNLPIAYILLPNKEYITYAKAFSLLSQEVTFWNCTIFVTDFEKAEI